MGLSSKDVAAATAAEDMTFHWSQIGGELDMAAKPPSTGQASPRKQQQQQLPPVVLKCPRCKSTNTKFCYYNNYSRTQPRHFCRACKRHWTEGGTLRNVPVGGSSGRKNNKRARTTKSSNVDSHQQQQQQEVAASAAAPFGLQLDNEFTDTLRQLVCQQQQQQFPSSLLPLPSDYTDIEQVCAPPPPPYDPGNPFSNAAPPPLCSTGLELAGDDNLLLCPSKWLQEPTPQMQQLSYWNFWDFGIADLSTQELLGQAEGLQ